MSIITQSRKTKLFSDADNGLGIFKNISGVERKKGNFEDI